MGMAKVNLGTLIRTRYVDYTARVIEEGEHKGHPWRVCSEARDRIKKEIREIIDVVGSDLGGDPIDGLVSGAE